MREAFRAVHLLSVNYPPGNGAGRNGRSRSRLFTSKGLRLQDLGDPRATVLLMRRRVNMAVAAACGRYETRQQLKKRREYDKVKINVQGLDRAQL